MKHILNDLSQEEKNRILEQHNGGKQIVIENFNKLLNNKLGSVRPLISEEFMPSDIQDCLVDNFGPFESIVTYDTTFPTCFKIGYAIRDGKEVTNDHKTGCFEQINISKETKLSETDFDKKVMEYMSCLKSKR